MSYVNRNRGVSDLGFQRLAAAVISKELDRKEADGMYPIQTWEQVKELIDMPPEEMLKHLLDHVPMETAVDAIGANLSPEDLKTLAERMQREYMDPSNYISPDFMMPGKKNSVDEG
jgi:hypothetical protein